MRQRLRLVATFVVLAVLGFLQVRGHPAALLLAGTAAYLVGASLSIMGSLIGARMLRPDIFIGWSFDTAEGIRGISVRLARLTSMLWPTWGTLGLIPPPRDSLSSTREDQGFRGAEYPFVLRATGDWEQAVEWLISNCRLAIFDISEEVSPSLAKEIGFAVKHLSPTKILFLEQGGDGELQVMSDGQPLEVPEVDELERLRESGASEEWVTLCGIRAWLAARVPVSEHGFSKRERWARIDARLPVWSNRLLFAALLSWGLHFLGRCAGLLGNG